MDRQQRLQLAQTKPFDLVIIGGGSTGAGVARDAQMRGLNCLLIDKGDFSSGTSSKSGKLIHGGLRYMRYGHFKLVRETCHERNHLMTTVAPHLVHPVRFVMPFYRESKTPLWLASLGLYLYDWFSSFPASKKSERLSPQQLSEIEPQLRTINCKGALTFYDGACLDSRLTIDTLKAAHNAGATLLNYCEALRIDFSPGANKILVIDRLTSSQFEVHTKAIVNAGGAWADEILARSPQTSRFKLKISAGIHLVLPKSRLPLKNTLALEAVGDHRNLYFVDWKDFVIVGTTDKFYTEDKDHLVATQDQIRYLLSSINYYFPNVQISKSDVQAVYTGIRPLPGSNQQIREERLSRDYIVIDDPRGIVSVSGGKLTSYRLMAEKTVDWLIQKFFADRDLSPCKTMSPISGGKSLFTTPPATNAIDGAAIEALTSRYGGNAYRIIKSISRSPELGASFSNEFYLSKAEILYCLEFEYCETLGDLLFRRVPAFLFAPQNGLTMAKAVAEFMGSKMGWPPSEIETQVQNYRQEVLSALQPLRASSPESPA